MGIKSLFRKRSKKGTTSSSPPSSPQESQLSPSTTMKPMTSSSMDELEQVFRKFDVNGDGKISSAELGSILSSLGHQATDDELQKMITEFDSDGDRFIGFQEFAALNNMGAEESEENYIQNLRDAFRVYDIDGNGSITAEELHQVMGSIGEACSMAECRRMISGVDSDADGMISFDEFKVMMMTGSRWDSLERSSS